MENKELIEMYLEELRCIDADIETAERHLKEYPHIEAIKRHIDLCNDQKDMYYRKLLMLGCCYHGVQGYCELCEEEAANDYWCNAN